MKTKVEKVNEIVFLRDTFNHKAEVEVKVGNFTNTVYLTTQSDEVTLDDENFKALKEAGMELDFSHIVEEYKTEVTKRVEKALEDKKTKFCEVYDTSWIYNMKTLVSKLVEFESREQFIARAMNTHMNMNILPNCVVRYKSHAVKVDAIHTGNKYNPTLKFQICNELTGYKKRNYAALKTLVSKIVELVDKKIAAQELRAKEAQAKETKEQAMLRELLDLFGDEKWTVTQKTEFQPSFYGRGRDVTMYYIVEKATGVEKATISKSIKSEKSGDSFYHLAGLKHLTAYKVKQILAIL